MVGAAVLCSLGALRSGAGLVKLETVKSQQNVAAKRAPLEVTTEGLPEDFKGKISAKSWGSLRQTINKFSPHVAAVGPGLGVSSGVRSIVKKLVHLPNLPLVLDADGINVIKKGQELKRKAPLIITPHPGELSRLLKIPVRQVQAEREAAAKKAARLFRGICVLKGAGTLITDGKTVWKNTTGNPGMASGGTGDVLTGIIASLWGQMPVPDQKNGFKAACLGVYLHGWAGDLAARKKGEMSLLASDIIAALPQAIQRFN